MNPWTAYPSAAQLEAQTPPSRDRVVDLVRGCSLLVVVFGHSFMALVVFRDGIAELSNTLSQTSELQLATWVLQIMPLFFAAGAWANALSYRKADSYPVWLSSRARRLLRPVIVYVGFWILASPLLVWWNEEVSLPLLRISTQLLWFLGAYLLVTALTPLLVRFSGHPVLASGGWLAAASIVDLSELWGGPPALRLLNFVLVWALAGQTGLWVFSATRRPRPSLAAAIATASLVVNVLLVAAGPWPRSLVGMPGERISNMAPPSLVMALHCITLAALVCILYAALARLAARPRVWRVTAVVNAAAMSIYLWHLVAMIFAILTLRLLGWDLPSYATDGWLAPRLLFWALFFVCTAGLVWLTRPFEHIPLPWWDARARRSPTDAWPYRLRATVSVVGVVIVAISVLALSVTGLVGFPFNSPRSYAGFEFTPGVAIGLTLLGMLMIRYASVGDARLGPSISAPGAEPAAAPAGRT